MRWVSSLFSFIVFGLIKCFQVHTLFTWKQGGMRWHSKMSILWSCQNVKQTSPLCSSRWDSQKTYMERLIRSPNEGVMPPERCSVVGTTDPSWNFWPAPEPGLPAQVGTFGPHPSQNFQLKLELSARTRAGTSSKPNKKGCLGMPFWIPIQTVPNSWKT
jgi:hypothetical protein